MSNINLYSKSLLRCRFLRFSSNYNIQMSKRLNSEPIEKCMIFGSLMEFDLPFMLLFQHLTYFRTQDRCYSFLL